MPSLPDRLLAGPTSILIARRLTTVMQADRIVLRQKGVLREWETHAELPAQRGLYWRLYQLQYDSQRSPEAGQSR